MLSVNCGHTVVHKLAHAWMFRWPWNIGWFEPFTPRVYTQQVNRLAILTLLAGQSVAVYRSGHRRFAKVSRAAEAISPPPDLASRPLPWRVAEPAGLVIPSRGPVLPGR
jgi:hypothetical protein